MSAEPRCAFRIPRGLPGPCPRAPPGHTSLVLERAHGPRQVANLPLDPPAFRCLLRPPLVTPPPPTGRPPPTAWAQRRDRLFLTLDIIDAKARIWKEGARKLTEMDSDRPDVPARGTAGGGGGGAFAESHHRPRSFRKSHREGGGGHVYFAPSLPPFGRDRPPTGLPNRLSFPPHTSPPPSLSPQGAKLRVEPATRLVFECSGSAAGATVPYRLELPLRGALDPAQARITAVGPRQVNKDRGGGGGSKGAIPVGGGHTAPPALPPPSPASSASSRPATAAGTATLPPMCRTPDPVPELPPPPPPPPKVTLVAMKAAAGPHWDRLLEAGGKPPSHIKVCRERES